MEVTVLDAGVVIAILDSSDSHHVVARQVVARAMNRGDRLVIPASAYAEVLVAPYGWGAQAVATVEAFLAAVPVIVEPATREVAAVAAELRSRHGRRLPLPDALVVATAVALSAARVLTTDACWPRVPVSVEVVTRSGSG
jgi:predicted nucleic acid-binding protein